MCIRDSINTIGYQWEVLNEQTNQFDPIPGETNANYDAPTNTAGSRSYRVILNEPGSGCPDVISVEVSVTVHDKPTITTEPSSIIGCAASTILSVVATGGVDGLTYQWEESATLGGQFTPISGETNDTFDTSANAPGSTTFYRVVISDTGTNCDSVTSIEVEVSPSAGLQIDTQPQDVTECVGVSTTLSVQASGNINTIGYQWEVLNEQTNQFDPIPGETNANYDAPTNTAGSRSYRVILNEPGSGCPDVISCLLYTSPSPRDRTRSRMPSSA